MNEYGDQPSVGAESPASQVMSEALDLAIEEKSPFPDRSLFLDANVPLVLRQPEMKRAAQEGTSVVLVSSDLSTRVLSPGEILGRGAESPDA